jgi:hypothetical protein
MHLGTSKAPAGSPTVLQTAYLFVFPLVGYSEAEEAPPILCRRMLLLWNESGLFNYYWGNRTISQGGVYFYTAGLNETDCKMGNSTMEDSNSGFIH